MPNPYQPPTDSNFEAKRVEATTPYQSLNAYERRTVRRGLRVVRGGYRLIVLGTLLGFTAFYGLGSGPAMLRIAQWLTLGIAIGGGFALAGTVLWSSVPGRHRRTSIPALALGAVACVLCTAYFTRLVGGAPVHGLLRLFGAASFAMLLTSQALISLATRQWALRRMQQRAARACEASVIAFAVCAVAGTTWAMGFQRSTGVLLLIQWISGMAAVSLHLAALETLGVKATHTKAVPTKDVSR